MIDLICNPSPQMHIWAFVCEYTNLQNIQNIPPGAIVPPCLPRSIFGSVTLFFSRTLSLALSAYYQVMTSFINFKLEWPNTLQRVIKSMRNVATIVAFDLMAWPGFGCLVVMPYESKLYLRIVLPGIIGLMMGCVCVCTMRVWVMTNDCKMRLITQHVQTYRYTCAHTRTHIAHTHTHTSTDTNSHTCKKHSLPLFVVFVRLWFLNKHQGFKEVRWKPFNHLFLSKQTK